MKIDPTTVAEWAAHRGLGRADVELQVRSLQVLDAIATVPEIAGVLALKGGAATNLFFATPQRFSRDLDFNVLEPQDQAWTQEHRANLEAPLRRAARHAGATLHFPPPSFSATRECACTFEFRGMFPGARTRVPVDINPGCRVPIYPVTRRDSYSIAGFTARGVTVTDIHETLAGKINAAIDREHPRDLFDIHRLRSHPELSTERLHLTVAIMTATTGALDQRKLRGWRTRITPAQFATWAEGAVVPGTAAAPDRLHDWASRVVGEAEQFVREAMPLGERARRFVAALLDDGVVDGALLSDDPEIVARVNRHPQLKWRAAKVTEYRRGNPG